MTLLGLDTSTSAAGACVLLGDGEAFEVAPTAERLQRPPAHASELMPAVAEAMTRAGVTWHDLDAIAVGVGPGTFTGLRIGIATARALAGANGLPLRRVSSLAALAAGIEAPLRLPLIDAKRGEVFGALYEGGELLWPPVAVAPEELAERLRKDGFGASRGRGPRRRDAVLSPLAAGDGSIKFREVLEEAGIQVLPDDSEAHVVRALHVCRLGDGAPDEPPEAVLPDYLRDPDAKPQQ